MSKNSVLNYLFNPQNYCPHCHTQLVLCNETGDASCPNNCEDLDDYDDNCYNDEENN